MVNTKTNKKATLDKALMIVDGEPNRKGYRLAIRGGIVDGVQVLDFNSKQEAIDWLMGWAYQFYTKIGKRLTPNLK